MGATKSRIGDLYKTHFAHIYAYCRRRTEPDAVEDAVSETFLVASRRETEVPEGEEALPWLYGVAYRVLSNQWRSKRRRANLHQKLRELGVDPMTIAEDYVISRFEDQQILRALSKLNRSDQEILRLMYWEELPHKTIATILDINPGAAKQRIHEARKRLGREYRRLEKGHVGIPAAQEGGGR